MITDIQSLKIATAACMVNTSDGQMIGALLADPFPRASPLPVASIAFDEFAFANYSMARKGRTMTLFSKYSATSRAAVPRTVWMLSLVSLLMDISTEMVQTLLPFYLVTGLGDSAIAVGFTHPPSDHHA